MKKYDYEVGCYADGAGGHQHCRNRLAQLVNEVCSDTAELSSKVRIALVGSLEGEMPDDACDEDEALELLNQYSNKHPDTFWQFHDGDLMLDWTQSVVARREAAGAVRKAQKSMCLAQRILCEDDENVDNHKEALELERAVEFFAWRLDGTPNRVDCISLLLSDKDVETIVSALIIAQDMVSQAMNNAEVPALDMADLKKRMSEFTKRIEERGRRVDEHNKES